MRAAHMRSPRILANVRVSPCTPLRPCMLPIPRPACSGRTLPHLVPASEREVHLQLRVGPHAVLLAAGLAEAICGQRGARSIHSMTEQSTYRPKAPAIRWTAAPQQMLNANPSVEAPSDFVLDASCGIVARAALTLRLEL